VTLWSLQYVAVHDGSHKPYSSFLDDICGTYMLFKHKLSTLEFLQTQIFALLQIFCRWRYWIISCGFWGKVLTVREFERSKITWNLLDDRNNLNKINILSPINYHIVTHSHNTATISSLPVTYHKHLFIF
jgi:hypothetical protein